MIRALPFIVAGAVAGCGLGYHRNDTIAITAAFHDHQRDILAFADLPATVARAPLAVRVAIEPCTRYYPLPVGFRLATADGHRVSWGTATVLTWAEWRPSVAPEVMLQAALATALTGDPAADLRMSCVMTHASWYDLPGSHINGGRVTTLLTVHRANGTVVFEGEHTTTGRAVEMTTLITAHAHEWLAERGLVAALGVGGAP